jgi:hypothetical protein
MTVPGTGTRPQRLFCIKTKDQDPDSERWLYQVPGVGGLLVGGLGELLPLLLLHLHHAVHSRQHPAHVLIQLTVELQS